MPPVWGWLQDEESRGRMGKRYTGVTSDGSAGNPLRFDTLRGRTALVSLVAALFYAQCVPFCYGTYAMPASYEQKWEFTDLFNATLVAALLIGALAWLVEGRLKAGRAGEREASGLHLVVPLALGHGLLIAATIVAWVEATSPSPGLTHAVAILAGAGVAVLLLMFVLIGRVGARGLTVGISAMYAGGMLIAMGLEVLPAGASFAARFVLLAVSLVLTLWTTRLAPSVATGVPKSTSAAPASQGTVGPACPLAAYVANARRHSFRDCVDLFLVPAVCLFALGQVYTVINRTAYDVLADASLASVLLYQAGGVVAVGLFLLCRWLGSRLRPTSLLNGLFGIVAAGLVLMLFLPSAYVGVFNSFAALGWKLAQLLLFCLVVETFSGDGRRIAIGCSLAFLLTRIVVVPADVSWFLSLVGMEGEPDAFVSMACLAFLLLYIILMAVWLTNSFERRRAQGRARDAGEVLARLGQGEADLLGSKCASLAERHGLTNRERDVVLFLAQGRDTAWICGELHLAKNTVKGYQRSAYAKLGVHSRQEIIDLMR